MACVALVGPDGAGKTTLARMLEASGVLPFRYLYMGVAISSSNLALPTSRWLERARLGGSPERVRDPAAPVRRGVRARVRGFARLGNRVAEESFRQLVSWWFQLRGQVVLCDRHYALDYAPEIAAAAAESLDRRLHRWFVTRVLPRPDLVIFLDAPAELLFARKGELTVEELERRRQGFLRQGERIPGFVRVDGTRPLAEVHAELQRIVTERFAPRRSRRRPSAAADAAPLA
jgi:thymidylate kinase